MKLEIGTIFRTRDGTREFRVKEIKLFPEPTWHSISISLVETRENVLIELDFGNLCDWFKQTEWEIV